MDKTVQVSVSLNSASNQQLFINSIPLKIEGSCKYLGVYVDSKLSFNLTLISYDPSLENNVALFQKCVIMFPKLLWLIIMAVILSLFCNMEL